MLRRIIAMAITVASVLIYGVCMAGHTSTGLEGVKAFDIDDLPVLRGGVQTRQFCSYDRAGDNYDWQYFPLYTRPNGEAVIFDAMGPGCLYRQHMNLWRGTYAGINIRYYFDDEVKSRIDMDVSTFFSDKNPLGIFREPFALDGGLDYRVTYYPMFFKKRLIVTLSEEPGGAGTAPLPWTGRYDAIPDGGTRWHWYNYTYHTYSEDPGIESWTPGQDMSAIVKLWDRAALGRDPKPDKANHEKKTSAALPAGKRIDLLDLEGAGSIAAIRLSLDPASEDALYNAWITMTWDGATHPQVAAPVGAFFGAYRTAPDTSYSSLLLGYSPTSMYCYFPMPYWKSARIAIENRGTKDIKNIEATIEYRSSADHSYPEGMCGCFYARYEKEFPRTEGHDYTYLSWAGKGHVVGHIVSRFDTSMEEDERTYFDNSRTPGVIGEGYEDDHGMGWGLKNVQHAVFGAYAANGGAGGVYRFFVPDRYCFDSAIKHGHQVYGPNSPLGHEGLYVIGNEESVTFFYGREKPGLVLTDEIDVGDPASESAHRYKITGKRVDKKGTYWYDGEYNNVLFATPAITDDGAAFTGHSKFTVAIDAANTGVRLRRRTDKDNNRQMAHVYVDGKLVTERPWYSVDYERTFRDIRWFDSDFEIPARYTRGRKSITITVAYLGSKNGDWDEYHYWIYSHH
jgi:hypothetical protein